MGSLDCRVTGYYQRDIQTIGFDFRHFIWYGLDNINDFICDFDNNLEIHAISKLNKNSNLK